MDKIKLAIVEDDVEWLNAMIEFLKLELDAEIVGTASNITDAMNLVQHYDFHILILDISLSENNLDGISIARQVKKIKDVKIIMLTSISKEKVVLESFEAGAVYYLPKSDFQQLPFVIKQSLSPFSPVNILAKSHSDLKEDNLLNSLTPSEREVFDLLRKGMKRTEIAENLFKTTSTVKNLITSIYKKIGVNGRTDFLDRFFKK